MGEDPVALEPNRLNCAWSHVESRVECQHVSGTPLENTG